MLFCLSVPFAAVGGAGPAGRTVAVDSLLTATAANTPPPIRLISFVRIPVFPETTGTPLPWYLRLANRLHYETRTSVIRQEILFREGTPYDPLRTSESERLLRDRGFFESVRITSVRYDGGYATTIRTQDLWTLGLNVDFQKQADLSSAEVSIRDPNFLGTGNGIRWSQSFSSDRDRMTLAVDVPRVAWTRASASAAYARGEDYSSHIATFSHPIETYFDRWSWDLSVDQLQGDQRFYESGREVGTSGYLRQNSVATLGRSNGLWLQSAFGGGWTVEKVAPRGTPRALAAGGAAPPPIEPLDFAGPLVFGGMMQRRFITATNLGRYGTVEDVPLGWSASIAVAGNVNHARDPDHTVAIRPVIEFATVLGGPEIEASAEAVGLAYHDAAGALDERLVDGSATLRWQPDPKALTIAQIGLHRAGHQPRSDIFYLGAGAGLRGYSTRAFAAHDFIAGTLEQRFWTGLEILWVGIGADAFVDAARPALDGHFDTERWRTGAGCGLLLGLRKSAQPPLRVEVAWRLDRRERKPTLSITTETWLHLLPQVALPTLFRNLHQGLR